MKKTSLFMAAAVTYVVSTAFTFAAYADPGTDRLTGEEIGIMCISEVYHSITGGEARTEKQVASNPQGNSISVAEAETSSYEENGIFYVTDEYIIPEENPVINATKEEKPPTEGAVNVAMETIQKSPETVVSKNENAPLIVIYHTHATESYQPVSEGNFHSTKEEGTVREVGKVLEEELSKRGYMVVHDKTMHDAESYNQSYSRSLNTVKGIMGVSKEPVAIIDLHRDAASYTGNVGKTVIIGGETVATFSLVVGKGNDNYTALYSFANNIVNTANNLYPGYGGRIIDKPYKYNQYVSDRSILLEVGNNENNIREAKASAFTFQKFWTRFLANKG